MLLNGTIWKKLGHMYCCCWQPGFVSHLAKANPRILVQDFQERLSWEFVLGSLCSANLLLNLKSSLSPEAASVCHLTYLLQSRPHEFRCTFWLDTSTCLCD